MTLGFSSMVKGFYLVNELDILVFYNSDLSWKSQINSNAVKLKRSNGALAKLRHFVPRNVVINAYYAIFHSHLHY